MEDAAGRPRMRLPAPIDSEELDNQLSVFRDTARAAAVLLQQQLRLKSVEACRGRKAASHGDGVVQQGDAESEEDPQLPEEDLEVCSRRGGDKPNNEKVDERCQGSDDRSNFSSFWCALTATGVMSARISQFAVVAEIVLVLQHTFSAMNYIKHKLRNRLTVGLVPALRPYLDRRYTFKLSDFLDLFALAEWEEGVSRMGLALAAKSGNYHDILYTKYY